MKHISVAVQWAIYEVPDDTFEILTHNTVSQPPLIVLEVMAMNGQAKRVGTVGSMTVGVDLEEDDDDDELPEDGGSIFGEDVPDEGQ